MMLINFLQRLITYCNFKVEDIVHVNKKLYIFFFISILMLHCFCIAFNFTMFYLLKSHYLFLNYLNYLVKFSLLLFIYAKSNISVFLIFIILNIKYNIRVFFKGSNMSYSKSSKSSSSKSASEPNSGNDPDKDPDNEPDKEKKLQVPHLPVEIIDEPKKNFSKYKNKSIIYMWFNKITSKVYIGSASDGFIRLNNYYQPSTLNRNDTVSRIYKGILKYGHSSFKLIIFVGILIVFLNIR